MNLKPQQEDDWQKKFAYMQKNHAAYRRRVEAAVSEEVGRNDKVRALSAAKAHSTVVF